MLVPPEAAASIRPPMRIDGEVVRADGAGVNWRELWSGTREVLVKSAAGVARRSGGILRRGDGAMTATAASDSACRRRSRDQAEVATAPEALADERKLEAKRERRDQHAHDVDFAKRQHYWAVLQTRSGSTIRKDVTPNAMPEKIAMLSFRVAARSYCIGLAGWTGA